MKSIQTIAFVLISTWMHAQTVTYQPLHGNYTNYGYHSQVWNGSELVEYYDKTVWGGDTLINGENYIRIYLNGMYAGGVREDVVNQERYFLDLNNVEQNISIGHFLEVGDTLSDSAVFLNAFRTYFDPGDNYNYYDSLVVGQVDTVLEANGSYSQTYHLEVPGEPISVFTYNTYRGLLNFDQLEFHVDQFCYKELDSTGSQGPGATICDLGINEPDLMQLELSPNPAFETIRLSGEDLSLIRNVVIYDLQGNKVKQLSLTQGDAEIHIDALKPGIYLLALNQHTRVLRFQKL